MKCSWCGEQGTTLVPVTPKNHGLLRGWALHRGSCQDATVAAVDRALHDHVPAGVTTFADYVEWVRLQVEDRRPRR